MARHIDGWHTISGYDCYMEDGRVLRAKIGKGSDQRTGYPYRRTRDGGWTEAVGVSPDTLRAGLARGTYNIQ